MAKASCDSCVYNVYDEDDETYYCEVDMDDDAGALQRMSVLSAGRRICSGKTPDVKREGRSFKAALPSFFIYLISRCTGSKLPQSL